MIINKSDEIQPFRVHTWEDEIKQRDRDFLSNQSQKNTLVIKFEREK